MLARLESAHFPYYLSLIRFERPIGSLLLLWPTFWGLWVAADGFPDWDLLLIFSLGVFVMRSAGCAINDIADRHVDGHVERTKMRPLAQGVISVGEARSVFLALLLCALLLVLQLNAKTILLSLGALLLAASYPFMKRYHHLPQVHLGAAFSFAIPMAFTAVTGEWPPLAAWVLFLANLTWTTAYDTIYALCDREDDLKVGVKSSAILFGAYDRLMIGLLQCVTVLLLIWAGRLAGLGWIYYVGLLAALIFFMYQHALIRDRDRALCFKAFLNNNWVGVVIFIGVFLSYMFA